MSTNKDTDIKSKSRDWYEDQYSIILIQRNFLILFGILISISMIITLILIKNMNDNMSIEPFIIEYDKNSGIMSVVDSKTKKEYVANEAVKESLFTQYLIKREELNLSNIDENMNYVRIMSSQQLYNDFIQSTNGAISELRAQGINSKYKVDINSITYLSPNRVEVAFTKSLISEDRKINESTTKAVIVFNFLDLEMNIDDMRINPLGFQVSFYRLIQEKDAKK